MPKNLIASVVHQASLPQQMGAYLKLRRVAADQGNPTSTRQTARLAARWLYAFAVQPQMDLMARMQVLEGVAGLPPWTWSKNPRAGLAEAKAHFGDQVHPSWFQPKTGMLDIIYSTVLKIVRKPDSAEDIVQFGLTGVNRSKGPLLYQTGVFHPSIKPGILSGEETPERVGSGGGGLLFRRMAITEINRDKNRRDITGPTVQDDDMHQIPDLGSNSRSLDRLVVDILTDPADPLGRKLRDRLQTYWSNAKGNTRTILDWWIDDINNGREPIQQQYAERLGIQIGMVHAAISRYVSEKGVPALLKDPKVQKDIELRLIREGRFANKRRQARRPG